MEILVARQNDTTFEVSISGRTTTSHLVMVSPEYHQQLTGGRVTPGELVERSVEFLLQRESNTSIMSMFDLPLIQSYFPEYERTMKDIFAE
jgi:hypothetical protein